MNAVLRALMVEDNPGDAVLIRETLKEVQELSIELIHVERLDEAIAHLKKEPFDVILLDLTLPDSGGLNTVRRTAAAAPDAPIVVLTGADDEMLGMEAVRLGAQDYLVKGQVDGRVVAKAIRYAMERKRTQTELRQARDELELRVRQRTEELEHALSALQVEFDDWRQAEKALRETEERFRQMADTVSEVFWVSSPDLRHVYYVNPAYEQLWGRPTDSLIRNASSLLDAIDPGERPIIQSRLQQDLERMAQGQMEQSEYKFCVVRPDGTKVTVRARIMPIRAEDKSLQQIYGVAEQVA